MSLTTSEMTPADIRACTCGNDGYNNGGMFGNASWAWIVILLLFGYGGRGFGFGGGFGGGQGGCGCEPCATQADLAAGFNNSAVLSNLNDLALGQAGIQQTLCQGFSGVNTAIMQNGYNTQAGFNTLSHQLADCCCQTQRAIDRVAYENQANTCALQNTINGTTRDILENANANSRAVLDFLVQDKISTLTAENQALKFQASQTAQNAVLQAAMDANTATILRRTGAEYPMPAYVVQPPTPVNFPTNCCGQVQFANNGCGCGAY